jgi:hypothetical protein
MGSPIFANIRMIGAFDQLLLLFSAKLCLEASEKLALNYH